MSTRATRFLQAFTTIGQELRATVERDEHGKNRKTPVGLCSQSDVASLLHALAV